MSITLDNLSIIQQKYIETINSICTSHKHAHTKEIAEILNVKMPSVVDALRTLAKMELIIYNTRKPVILTKNGKEIASKLHSRHKIFSDFFHNILGLSLEYSEKLACSIEHVVDDKIKERLSSLNSYLDSTPESAIIVENFKKLYS